MYIHLSNKLIFFYDDVFKKTISKLIRPEMVLQTCITTLSTLCKGI